MSGEVEKPLRVDPAALQPGDVLFFGCKGVQVEAVGDRSLGDLRRQRLVRPLLERRRDAPAPAGLVRDDACLGTAPDRRGRPPRSDPELVVDSGRGRLLPCAGSGPGTGRHGGPPRPGRRARRRGGLPIPMGAGGGGIGLIIGSSSSRSCSAATSWAAAAAGRSPPTAASSRPPSRDRAPRPTRVRRPVRVHEVRQQGRTGPVDEPVQGAEEYTTCPGRHVHDGGTSERLRAGVVADRAVLLPGRQQGVPRPLVLPGARAAARRIG